MQQIWSEPVTGVSVPETLMERLAETIEDFNTASDPAERVGLYLEIERLRGRLGGEL